MRSGGARSALGAFALVGLGSLAFGLVLGGIGEERLVLVPGLIGAGAVIVQPLWGLVGMVFLIPFEAMTMDLIAQGATATRLLGMLVAGAWLTLKLLHRESWDHIVQSRILIAIAVFVTFTMASTLWARVPFPVVSELIRFAMWASLTVLVLDLVRRWKDAHAIVTALALGGIVASFMVVEQYFGGGARRAGGDIAGGINATAVVLVSLLPFGFYLVRRPGYLSKALGLTHLALSLLAITVTFSRMSMMMVPVVILIEFLYSFRSGQGRTAMVAFGVVALVVGIRVAPQDAIQERIATIGPYLEATLQGGDDDVGATSSRGFHIRVALAVFQDHPVIGAGHMSYGALFRDEYQFEVPGRDALYLRYRSSHGSFWGFLADLGLVGVMLWSLCILAAVAALWRAHGHLRRVPVPPLDGRLLIHAVGLVLFVQVAFMTYAEIHARKTFWVILGLSAALERLAAREAAAHEAEGDEEEASLTEAEALPAGISDLRTQTRL